MRILLAWVLTSAALGAVEPFPPFYESDAVFHRAADRADRDYKPLPDRVSGITVPHHVPAVDLAAVPFQLAAAGQYDRIVVISPDHHSRGKSLCSTTDRDYLTASGLVETDDAAVAGLLKNPDVSLSGLFSHEHGVMAVLPLVRRYFPSVPVVTVALEARSQPGEWARMAAALRPVVSDRTLLVQSTDFSHYLNREEAKHRDQQTLHVLATGNADLIAGLDQPQHLDSKCCQYVQARLQRDIHGITAPVVVDNRNVAELGASPAEPRTTSYITQLWTRGFVPASKLPGEAWFFGGDTFFGRGVARRLETTTLASAAGEKIRRITNGGNLVVNLEGVFFPGEPPRHAHPLFLGMNGPKSVAILRQWGARAAIVSNNHRDDFGEKQREYTRGLLEEAGIRVLDSGPPADMGRFLLGCGTDTMNQPGLRTGIIEKRSIESWTPSRNGKPLIAWFHAGDEYQTKPNRRVMELADWAGQAGAVVVGGCHPHVSTPDWDLRGSSLRWYSTGNFLFDQHHADGKLLEIRFFPQGTCAARAHPIGNLHDAGKAVSSGGP